MTPQELKHQLSAFIGTSRYYRHICGLILTDGAKFFADKAGAYWFMDIVATELLPLLRTDNFLIVTIHSANNQADLVADDGNGNVRWSRHIDYTDCPEGKWEFYVTDNVIMVPSVY